MESQFKNVPVIGAMPANSLITLLNDYGDVRLASTIQALAPEQRTSIEKLWSHIVDTPIWKYSTLALGFLPRNGDRKTLIPVGRISADTTLKNSQINIKLNRLRVANYPGTGNHQILFDFCAHQQVNGTQQSIHFNQVYQVSEHGHAPIVGYPIFLGLPVGADGVAFEGVTVNVKNDTDEKILNIIDSDTFKAGLKLATAAATTAMPAIGAFSEIALGITKMILTRNRNVAVQKFSVGLDFDGTVAGARLAEGDYIFAQVPDPVAQGWNQWEYEEDSGCIVRKDTREMMPYNYLLLGVSRG